MLALLERDGNRWPSPRRRQVLVVTPQTLTAGRLSADVVCWPSPLLRLLGLRGVTVVGLPDMITPEGANDGQTTRRDHPWRRTVAVGGRWPAISRDHPRWLRHRHR